MKNIVVAFLLLAVVSCKQPTTNATGSKIGEEFDLKYGQSTQIQDHEPILITFRDVGEDSRCPKGAVCVWQGNARIVLQVAQQDTTVNTTLEPKEITYSGRDGFKYTIRLVSVSPYPNAGEQIKLEDYSIKLIVFTNEIF